MKRISLLNKSIVFLLMISMSLTIFTGCQSKSSQDNASQASSSNSSNEGDTSNTKKPNLDEMKKRMEDNISSLVKDGTINQTQADKIVEALTANTSNFNGQRKSTNNQQNDQQAKEKNDTESNKQNKPRNNRLSKLVSDGVITQAQADTVMQKIRGNSTRPQDNQSSAK